jgi:hypothetical protein
MYLRLGECKNDLDAIKDAVLQLKLSGGQFPPEAITDLNDIAAMAKVAYPIFPALLGALGTIAQDIVTWGGYMMTDLDVIVQRLGQLVTRGLTGNSEMEGATGEDIAAAAAAVAQAIDDGSDSIYSAITETGNEITNSTDTIAGAVDSSSDVLSGAIEETSGQVVDAVKSAGNAITAQISTSSDGLARDYKESAAGKEIVTAVNNTRDATTEALLKQLAEAKRIAENGGSAVQQMKALQDELTAYQGLISQAVKEGNQRLADGYRQAADNVRQQLEAMAHQGAIQAEHIDALKAELKLDQELMARALAAGDEKTAEAYRQAAANVQSELLPLLSAEVTYTRDAALAEGQLASTLPKEIAGVGMAATGAGNLVAAHVDAAAVTIGTAVIAQGAFMQAAAAAILSAAASMGKAGAGNVYGGGSGGSSGTPITGPGSPGYGQAQQPSGPTTGTGGFGGTVAKPSTNAPGAPSSASTPYTSPNKGSTGVYVSDPNALPMFATGGEVVKGGIAFVDQGEIVQPAEKGSSPDYAGILRDAMQIDAQLQRLVDQVSSQQAWIAQMAANGAPPAMMELLQKQLEGYQKALTLYEVQMGYAKQTADNTAGLPALHPQPVGTQGTPLPVELPTLKPQPVGTQGHPLPGTSEFPGIFQEAPTSFPSAGSALTGAQIFGSPAFIDAMRSAVESAVGPSSGGGSIGQSQVDPQTLGFYAATDAELEDIRNTLLIEKDLISSMRDSWVAFQTTSHNDSMIVGQAIIDAIGGKAPKPMKSFDFGGPVGMDMIAQLHAGEEVLAPDISTTLRRMLTTPSGGMHFPNPAGDMARGGSRVLTIHAPVTINGMKGGRAAAEEFVEHLRRIVPDSNGFSS